MKDKEKKSKRDKKKKAEKKQSRRSKFDKAKPKNNVKKSQRQEDGKKPRTERDKKELKPVKNEILQNSDNRVNLIPTNNLNIQKETLFDINNDQIGKKNLNNEQFQGMKQSMEFNVPHKNQSYTKEHAPEKKSKEQKSNEKENLFGSKRETAKRKSKISVPDKEGKELKIRRTSKDYGVGEYSSIKILTKHVNGKLFHDVNIQTTEQTKKLSKKSSKKSIPLIKNSLCNQESDKFYDPRLKISKELELNEKDIVLAKIQRLKRMVTDLNKKYLY
uniref:Uncharacterized protein n=1 Tax=Parastrongyloides trichosuri TaxID=131310 RepID=A0A0N4ZSF4_PARTI